MSVTDMCFDVPDWLGAQGKLQEMRLAREPEANSSRTLTKIWDSTLSMMGSHGGIEEGSDLMRLFQKDHSS